MVDDTAHPARLTLPGWSGPAPVLPPARRWLLLTAGCRPDDAECALPAWQHATGTTVRAPVTGEDLIELLHDERLGVRVAVCGPESGVADLVAAATRAGLMPDEIVAHAHGVDERRVFCPACGTTSAATTGRCRGCGCELLPHQHFARRRGAYLSTPSASGR